MSSEEDDEMEEVLNPSPERYEYNEDAFSDAVLLSNQLLAHPARSQSPCFAESCLQAFCRRLARSSDSIILAKFARRHKLTPPRLSLVVILLTSFYMRRYITTNEVLIGAVGFNPPEADRLYEWASHSPLFEMRWDGMGLSLSPSVLAYFVASSSLTDDDERRFRHALAALPVATRPEIPDNQQPKEPPD